MYGDAETAIVFASNSTYLGIGTQPVELNFNGLAIAQSKMDGPYTLSYLTLYDENDTQIDFIYEAYNTPAYNYTDFQSPTASFRDTYSDYGLDTNGDGFYEYLTVEIGLNVTIAGNYITHGCLYDTYGNETAEIYNLTYLNAGDRIVRSNFDGISIYKHGVNGSFNLTNLLLYDENATLMDNRYYAYTTSPYNYTDFQPRNVTVSKKGDLNCDGEITPTDAAIALRLAVSGEWRADADVSGDDRVTSLDALMILQAAAGAIGL